MTGKGINQKEYEDTRLILEARSRILEENAFRWVLEVRELTGMGINRRSMRTRGSSWRPDPASSRRMPIGDC
jgi:hypothetical protein